MVTSIYIYSKLWKKKILKSTLSKYYRKSYYKNIIKIFKYFN